MFHLIIKFGCYKKIVRKASRWGFLNKILIKNNFIQQIVFKNDQLTVYIIFNKGILDLKYLLI